MVWKFCFWLHILKCLGEQYWQKIHRSAQAGMLHIIWVVYKEGNRIWAVPQIRARDKQDVKKKGNGRNVCKANRMSESTE